MSEQELRTTRGRKPHKSTSEAGYAKNAAVCVPGGSRMVMYPQRIDAPIDHPHGRSLGQIAKDHGISRATVHRLVQEQISPQKVA